MSRPVSRSSFSTFPNCPRGLCSGTRYAIDLRKTFYQKEEPFTDLASALTLEQKVQSHFEKLKLDDKVVLEKFLRLKKDDNALASKRPRNPKPTMLKN